MERPDRFSFGPEFGDELRQGLPPIVGSDGGSSWFAGAGHVEVPEFPMQSEGGFFLGFDFQPDTREPHVLLGVQSGNSAFLVEANNPEPSMLTFTVRNREGDQLVVRAEGSRAAAQRVLVTGDLRSNTVAMYEIEPWASRPGESLDVEILESGATLGWPPPEAGFSMSGALVDGHHRPGYSGRMAEVYLGDHMLDSERPQAFASASDNPCGLSRHTLALPSSALRQRFHRDLGRLRRWVVESRSAGDDIDDASLILYRWLFDRHPLVVDLAASLGVQLWLPGMSDHERRYLDVVLQDKPTFQMTGVLGPESAFGFQWRAIDVWRAEAAFHVNGHAISHEAFIKFVRNKLGAGHFDEHERTRWQKELSGFSAELRVMGQDALVVQMRAIAEAVLLGVAVSRLEARTR